MELMLKKLAALGAAGAIALAVAPPAFAGGEPGGGGGKGCNAGNGNGSEVIDAAECDPGNSGANNQGGD